MSIESDIKSAMSELERAAPDNRSKTAIGKLSKALQKLAKKVEAKDKNDPEDSW